MPVKGLPQVTHFEIRVESPSVRMNKKFLLQNERFALPMPEKGKHHIVVFTTFGPNARRVLIDSDAVLTGLPGVMMERMSIPEITRADGGTVHYVADLRNVEGALSKRLESLKRRGGGARTEYELLDKLRAVFNPGIRQG
jgi:hypothetical protein